MRPAIKIAEGTPFIPPHGSSGSKFLIEAVGASFTMLKIPSIVASGHATSTPPFPNGLGQTFADDVRRHLNDSLGLVVELSQSQPDDATSSNAIG